jgi:5-methylcytosine-specific restriction endonuclease McrA
MPLDLGEGWTVEAVPQLNTMRWEYSPLRAYQQEQLSLAEQERANRAAEAEAARSSAVRPPIAKDVQSFVWQRDGGHCVDCGSNENLEFDHIIPFSRGGSSTARNIQLLCETCNRRKGGTIG